MTCTSARLGRPRIHKKGSEVFSVRVPMGTAKLLNVGFKTISKMSGEQSNPAVVILETQRDRIASLKDQHPELARHAVEGIEHVLKVLKRSAEQSGE